MKHVRPRQFVPLGIMGALALALAFSPGHGRADAQSAGPPAPPVPNGTPNPPSTTPLPAGNATPLASNAPIPSDASPSASPSSGGRHRRRAEPASTPSPEPSATPTSPAFATLDGTWETQLQYIDRTDYSYLVVKQNATGELSGFWRVGTQQYPLTGSYDGRLIRLQVKEAATSLTWSGYVEGASDMVGTIDFGKGDPTPFTAEHRAAPKNPFKKEPKTGPSAPPKAGASAKP